MSNGSSAGGAEVWVNRGERVVRSGVEWSRRGWARAWPWMRSHPRACMAGGGVLAVLGFSFALGMLVLVSVASRGGGSYGNGYGYGVGHGGASPADAWIGPNDWQSRHSSGTWAGENSVISPPGGGVLNLPPY
ncbi:MAG: hypothetical protein AAGK04_10915 [Planctomycetota bacterium]